MKKVEYYGSADVVTITDQQFKKVGVDSKTQKWTQGERVQEVADDAADYLLKYDSARFREVDGASGTPSPDDTGSGTDGE